MHNKLNQPESDFVPNAKFVYGMNSIVYVRRTVAKGASTKHDVQEARGTGEWRYFGEVLYKKN